MNGKGKFKFAPENLNVNQTFRGYYLFFPFRYQVGSLGIINWLQISLRSRMWLNGLLRSWIMWEKWWCLSPFRSCSILTANRQEINQNMIHKSFFDFWQNASFSLTFALRFGINSMLNLTYDDWLLRISVAWEGDFSHVAIDHFSSRGKIMLLSPLAVCQRIHSNFLSKLE